KPTTRMSRAVLTTSSAAVTSAVAATETETKAKTLTKLPPLTLRSPSQTTTNTAVAAECVSDTTSSITASLPPAAAPLPPPPKTPQLEEGSKSFTPPTPDNDKPTTPTSPTLPKKFRPPRPALTPTSRSNLTPSPLSSCPTLSQTPAQPRIIIPQSPPQLSPQSLPVAKVAPAAVIAPRHEYQQQTPQLTQLQPSSLPSLLQPQRQQLPPLQPAPPAQQPPLSGLQVPRLKKPPAYPPKLPPLPLSRLATSSGVRDEHGAEGQEEVSLQQQQVLQLPAIPHPASAGGFDREQRISRSEAQEKSTADTSSGVSSPPGGRSSTSAPTSFPSPIGRGCKQQNQERVRQRFQQSSPSDNDHDGHPDDDDETAAIGATDPRVGICSDGNRTSSSPRLPQLHGCGAAATAYAATEARTDDAEVAAAASADSGCSMPPRTPVIESSRSWAHVARASESATAAAAATTLATPNKSPDGAQSECSNIFADDARVCGSPHSIAPSTPQSCMYLLGQAGVDVQSVRLRREAMDLVRKAVDSSGLVEALRQQQASAMCW
ncbi:hypothetical protein VaNZ11_009895, partial [Volvox africanus]